MRNKVKNSKACASLLPFKFYIASTLIFSAVYACLVISLCSFSILLYVIIVYYYTTSERARYIL